MFAVDRAIEEFSPIQRREFVDRLPERQSTVSGGFPKRPTPCASFRIAGQDGMRKESPRYSRCVPCAALALLSSNPVTLSPIGRPVAGDLSKSVLARAEKRNWPTAPNGAGESPAPG